jgi:hypothetical protein
MWSCLPADKEGKDKDKDGKSQVPQLAVPRLSVCADAQKVDRTKLAQSEVQYVIKNCSLHHLFPLTVCTKSVALEEVIKINFDL